MSVARLEQRHKSSDEYAAYEERLAQQHILPLLRRLGVPLDHPILDAGCAVGGVAIALASCLDAPVHGIDVVPERIEHARRISRERGVPVRFEVVDIISNSLPEREYGLIMLRDVVEHLWDIETALTRLRGSIAESGVLYVVFPPWRGPYAGHQHNAKSVAKFLPYLHALAPSLFFRVLERLERGRDEWLADANQVFINRLTQRKFERIAHRAGWEIMYRESYILRPAFMRMGLPTIRAGFLGRLPFVGETLSTACEYVLTAGPSKTA